MSKAILVDTTRCVGCQRCVVLILAAGFYSTLLRFTQGLGAATHLTDRFPWGLWIGFDVICGVGLAAGGFTLAAVVYVFAAEPSGEMRGVKA